MFCVYVLLSQKSKRLYVGSTGDIRKRIREHNEGKVRSTKAYRPWQLVFYEGFRGKADALRDEKFYKTGFGKEALKSKLKETLWEGWLNG